MHLIAQKNNTNIKQKQVEKEKQEMSKCSFKPQISRNSKLILSNTEGSKQASTFDEKLNNLYNGYKNKKERKDKSPEEVDFEKNWKECYFHPNTMRN